MSPRSHQSIVVHQEAASPASSSQSGPRLDLCRMISLNNISSFNMSRCAAVSLHSSRASRLFLTHFSVNRRAHRHCRLLQHHGDDGGPTYYNKWFRFVIAFPPETTLMFLALTQISHQWMRSSDSFSDVPSTSGWIYFCFDCTLIKPKSEAVRNDLSYKSSLPSYMLAC